MIRKGSIRKKIDQIFIRNVSKNSHGCEFRNDTFYFQNFNLTVVQVFTVIYSYLRFKLLANV